MPYISSQRRRTIQKGMNGDGRGVVPGDGLLTPGELTYVLQQVVKNYITDRDLSYTTLVEAMGALEGCRADFVNRVLIPFEEGKRVENGDVWGSLAQRAGER